ncbi:cell wall metabolism sensor histidine kinase WalK [Ignavigranum ruoffiae]
MNRRPFNFFQSIYFKIPLLFVFILLIVFQFIGVYFINELEMQSLGQFKTQINSQADFLTNNLSPILSEDLNATEQNDRLNQVLSTFTTANPTKLLVVNPQETIIATNQDLGETGVGAQTSMPKLREVLLSQTTIASEMTDGNTQDRLYQLIKPIMNNDLSQVLGAVVIETNMESVYTQTDNIIDLFIQSALFAAVLALILSVIVSQGITRPIENMRQQAIRISEGVYNYPAELMGYDELGELALTINELAEKVKDAQESTESERQRLDGILRHMTDGVIGTDQRGNVLLVNDRALYLLDMPHERAIGKSILRLLDVHQNYSMRDLLKGDQDILIERPDRHGNNSILKGEFSVIRRETGFATGLVCVLTDITEQEKTERERRDFVSNVSHELRTPLTSLKSYSEALSDGAWKDPDLAPQFLEVIQSESNRMIRMIANLLNLSKMDGGQIVLEKEYVDFKRIVDHILDRIQFTLESEGQSDRYQIVREYTSRDIYVDIDQDRMTQVIDNLLNNALKYSPDGGQITVRIEDNLDSVIFTVIDQGLGISKADQEHLFKRFYRVDKARSRAQGGSGLGLAISKEVIELHGGTIWVNSVEGQGSQFSFELPYSNYDDIDEEWE